MNGLGNIGAFIGGSAGSAIEIETIENGFIVHYTTTQLIEPPAPPRPGKSKMTMKVKAPVSARPGKKSDDEDEGYQDEEQSQEMEIFAEDLTQVTRAAPYTVTTRKRRMFKAKETRSMMKFLKQLVEVASRELE